MTPPKQGTNLEYDVEVAAATRYLQQRKLPSAPTPDQYIKAIALAAPTVCGGGAFTYGGKAISPDAGHAFQGAIVEHDSRSGTSVGLLTEAGGGERAEGGASVITNSNGQSAGLVFVGGGANLPGAEGSAGALFTTEGAVGLYGEIGAGSGAVGGGAYVNITTNGACLQHK